MLELIQTGVTKDFRAVLHSRLSSNTYGFPTTELAVAFSVAPGSLLKAVEAACFSTWTVPCPEPLERGQEPSFTEPSGGDFICCTIVLFWFAFDVGLFLHPYQVSPPFSPPSSSPLPIPPPLFLFCFSSDTGGPPMDVSQPWYIKLH